MKPKKTVYKNQEEIKKLFFVYIKPFFKKHPQIKKAFISGSLANGTFGTYEKEYKGHNASDIDLVIFLDNSIPRKWKNLESTNADFELYKDDEFRRFNYKNNVHKIDIIIPHNKIIHARYERIK